MENKRAKTPSGWMKPDEAAEYLGTTVKHLYKLTHSGDIPHGKLGKYLRFKAADLDAWMRESAQGAS